MTAGRATLWLLFGAGLGLVATEASAQVRRRPRRMELISFLPPRPSRDIRGERGSDLVDAEPVATWELDPRDIRSCLSCAIPVLVQEVIQFERFHGHFAILLRRDVSLPHQVNEWVKATRDRRADSVAERKQAELLRALDRLPDRLERIWRSPKRTLSARRRLLFALWDECAEEGEGRIARGIILDFIHRRLPERSPAAYTESELVELDYLRTSTERFEPYAAGW